MVRAAGAFYASATSASWAPIFPVFRSADLVHWSQVGAVLPSAPRSAAGNFWAPELVRWSGRMLAFYSASRRGGAPCIGLASAARPEGPWRDRGPVLCRPGGTIDADPFTDADDAPRRKTRPRARSKKVDADFSLLGAATNLALRHARLTHHNGGWVAHRA